MGLQIQNGLTGAAGNVRTCGIPSGTIHLTGFYDPPHLAFA